MDSRAMLAVGESGESSGRKWGTGRRVRKGEGERWVLRAHVPLLAQEDPVSVANWGQRMKGDEGRGTEGLREKA
eukprot:5419412-Pyramimonas_sp.AAC.1